MRLPNQIKTKDFALECSVCGAKVGVLTLGYFGIPHHFEPMCCCVKCLPRRLEQLEKEGFDKDRIEIVRKWLKKGE